MKALELEVQLLKNQQAAPAPPDTRAIDSTIDSVRLESDRQSALMDVEGFTSGYSDGRFVIQSADKRYVLHPWLQLQFRNVTTYRASALRNGADSDTQNGFEIRRLKLGFDGNVIAPDLTYLFQFAVDRKTGNFSLEQAYGKYKLQNSPFYVKGGQYKEPLDHEQLLASRYLTAADRTLVDDLYANSEGFVQGISLGFDNAGALRGEAAFTDGQRSGNTNFQDFPTTTADYGFAARAEYKAFGRWSDYDRSLGAYGSKSQTLVFGAGADYTEAGDTRTFTHVLDAQYLNPDGIGLYAAYLGRVASHAAIGSVGSNGGTIGNVPSSNGYDSTLRLQASYALDEHWEPYLQYEYINLASENLPAGVNNEIHVLRAGVNYYLYKTEARITLDVSYLPNGSPISDDGIGILATGASTKTSGVSTGGGNEVVLRAQFQLAL